VQPSAFINPWDLNVRNALSARHALNRRHLIATALLAAAASALPMRQLAAQTPEASPKAEAPRFSLHPLEETAHGYPELELEPGATGELRVGVTNSGSVPVELTLFRADAVAMINGGFAAADLADEPTGHTLWMDLEPTEIGAEPGETTEIAISVAIPADAAPGQYVTSLVAQTNPLAITGTEMFNQVLRNALPVVISVPGPVTPGMDVGEPVIAAQAALRFIQIPVANTGNILIKPEGEVVMTTPDGEPVIIAPVAMKSIYLGLATEIRVAIPDQVAPGDYRISYVLTEPTHGLQATQDDVPVTLTVPEAAEAEEAATLVIDPVTVTPTGDPVQFADVAVTLVNNGSAIPTARVSLVVLRDGEEVETYDLANNQALPQGTSTISQRYLPATGWKTGTWTFRVVVTGLDASGAETALAEVDVVDEVVVP